MFYTLAALGQRITSVIFDFGGVLGLPQDPDRVAAMASLCRLSPQAFLRLYQRDRLELDRGTLRADEYWRRLFSAGGVTPTPELISRIEREDALGWTRVNARVVAWAAELRGAGYRTAILSNMPADKLAFMRRDNAFGWINDFPVVVFSCDHLLVKPEPAIFRLCLDLLGEPPGACIFLDDTPANVIAARDMGIAGQLFLTPEEAASALAGTWGLPVRSLVNGVHA
ncbi:MAG: HAD family phosphatase [Spirochaetia bacterium]|jgi:putative hydrolase of the HAD superfamily